MKINKFVEDLKAKSVVELNEELVAAKKELFNLRFQNATNQLDNTSRIKEVRRNIARIQTVITEKSAMNAEKNIFTFKVAKDATKTEIKWAVEKAFNVTVVKVNTLNTKPKDKRVGKYTGKTKTYKKAIITLKDGENIEI